MSQGPVLSEPTTITMLAVCPATTLSNPALSGDVITPRDVIMPRDLSEEYSILCSSDTAELWHQHKCSMNFSEYADEDFLLFLLYQTVKSLSNNFSDTLVVPPLIERPKLSTALQTPSPSVKQQTPTHVTRKTEQDNNTFSHECAKCKKSFRNKYYLSRHEKRSCNRVNPLRVYHCQHCAAVVTSMTSLSAHMKQRHRDIRLVRTLLSWSVQCEHV